jgi:tartrate-resistant acid phosphatase type 5
MIEMTRDLLFFAIGDFGRNCTRTLSVASAMNTYAVKHWNRKPDFVLALGDNFYPHGVTSADDPKFQESWERVFLGHENLRVPWKVVLGNHDYMENFQAQIDFTHHANNPKGLWQMPGQNYKFTHNVPGESSADPAAFSAEFFALDTNGCQGHVRRSHPGSETDLIGYIADLSSALAASRADWKIVFAHHPLYTVGLNHGGIGRCLRDETYTHGSAWPTLTRAHAHMRIHETNTRNAVIEV